VLVQRGHTYVAAADLPPLIPLSVVRNELVSAGFVRVSVRAAENPNYNVIGQGTWTGPDQSIDLPSQVVWAHDITPAAVEEHSSPEAGAPELPVGPGAPTPSPLPPSPSPPSHHASRRRAPTPPDPSIQVVAVLVAGIGGLVLWKLKKDGFWNRRAWR